MLKKPYPIALCALMLTGILMAGCKKTDNKPTASGGPKAKLVLIHGDGQSGTYGQDLHDSLVVQITPPFGKMASQYAVTFNMLQGNGLVEGVQAGGNVTPLYGSNGLVQIKWRLGCNNPGQKLTIYLYADSLINYGGSPKGSPDDSLVVSANGTAPTGWGRACGCNPPSYMTKIATFDKKTLYMASNGLFSSTDGGINWYKVNGAPYWSTVQDVQFNSKGWMYILTANNGIYYSQDAKSWTAINNGILDMRTPTAFTVAGDWMFVSFYFDGPYMTTNNGGFWQKFLVGFGSQRFYLIRKHPNGSIYMFNDWTDLLVSKDTAKTWQVIPTNGAQVNYAAYDMEIGPTGNIYVGSDDATIATFSPATNQATYKSFYQWNASDQPCNNINFYNGDVYFLLNDNPQPGIYQMSTWSPLNLGFNEMISSYFIRPDGTFLLITNDGVYYKN